MKDKKNLDKAFFEVEADLNSDPDKIYKTITKNGLILTEFSLKEKKEICIYTAYYELTEENLSALDTLKNNNKEISLFKIRNLDNLNIFGHVLEELVKKVKNEKHIKYRRNYNEYSKFNFIKAIGADGLELIDNYSNEKTDKVIGFMLKTLGKNFLSGKNLTQISLPIYINDDRTFLEMIGFNLSLAYKYLDKASLETSHLERLKLCVSFFITNLHHTLIGYKPFNPIIGETYQAVVKSPHTKENEKHSNIHIYAEQTSHHPPILNFYGFSDSYKIKGYRETSAIASGNCVVANVQGPFNLEFKEANIIAHFPPFSFFGLIYGKRMFGYNGVFKIEDVKNGLIAIIDINPKQQSKGFFGSIFGKKEKIFPDYFKGYIAKTTDVKYDQKKNIYNVDESKILSHIEGEYNNYIEIDGKNVWNIAEFPYAELYLQDFMLPSDSQFRNDLILYKNEKIEMAQYSKMSMEDSQRKDAKLRKKYQESKEKVEKIKKK